MNHQLITLLIIFGILGIINSVFLIKKRLRKEPLVCPIGDDCNKVIESKYNKILFVKNDVLGLIYYVLIIVSLYFLLVSKNILVLMQIISGLALLVSLYLFYIQARVIREYCFYCNLATLINLFIFLILVFL